MIVTILVCAVILLVAAALWLASLALFVATRRHETRWKRRLCATPFAALTLLMFAAFGFGGYVAVPQREEPPSSPRALWSHRFGFAPPADVRALRSATSLSATSTQTFLRFIASPPTVARLARSQKMRALPAALTNAQLPSLKPTWWQPRPSPTLRAWQSRARSGEISPALFRFALRRGALRLRRPTITPACMS